MKEYPLTIQEFQEWLEGKDEKEIVGEMGCKTSCPLANALKQKAKLVRVTADTTIADDYCIVSNPNWVEKFVRRVDNLSDDARSVTAREALEILNEVERYDIH